jgi:hypothetical protein
VGGGFVEQGQDLVGGLHEGAGRWLSRKTLHHHAPRPPTNAGFERQLLVTSKVIREVVIAGLG